MATTAMPHGTPQPGAPLELDLNDLSVPLTTERALGLQAELYRKFNEPSFQQRLKELKEKHDEWSPELRKLRQRIVLQQQSEVLPKYGYQATPEGVKEMVDAVRGLVDDPLVQSNIEVLNHVIGASGDDVESWMAAHASDVSHLDELSHDIAPMGPWEPRAVLLEFTGVGSGPVDGRNAEANPATTATGLGVELDLTDVHVPLTKERVLFLQQELLEAFSTEDFQASLQELKTRHATSSLNFRRARQQLALQVQEKVLPKYGYRGTLTGVAQMITDIHERFADEPEVTMNIQAIDRLILSEARASSPFRQQTSSGSSATEGEDSAEGHVPFLPSPRHGGASAKASPRRKEMPSTHVTAKDGY
mmetsp:Transcript_69768/g.175718  ORF Transcript_69768/g.175718 Transcript_69768/m.175718 type:complete len:362 (+) Transcript_69768:97-1182(+)